MDAAREETWALARSVLWLVYMGESVVCNKPISFLCQYYYLFDLNRGTSLFRYLSQRHRDYLMALLPTCKLIGVEVVRK